MHGVFAIPVHPVTFRAKWIWPVVEPPIENGYVTVFEGKIVELGKHVGNNNPNTTDVGDAVIVPGLVNAHTHLEFSFLESPLGPQGIPFTDWIPKVIAARQAITEPEKLAAIQSGLTESIESGTRLLGEIATLPYSPDVYVQCEAEVVRFLEQLGRDPAQLPMRKTELARHFELTHHAGSPHAPYSTSPQLLTQMVELAEQSDRLLAMHLAESPAEIELLETQSGAFVELLESLGVWNADSFQPKFSILDHLKQLARCCRSLVIHGNYLTEKESDFIANNRDRMSIVFCPRTHAHFEHAPYPLLSYLEKQINVAVGTDSRASNPDLRLLNELKLVREKFPSLSPSEVMKMGTLNGAVALGFEESHGAIQIGKSSQLSVIRPNQVVGNSRPTEWVFNEDASCHKLDWADSG